MSIHRWKRIDEENFLCEKCGMTGVEIPNNSTKTVILSDDDICQVNDIPKKDIQQE